MPYKIVKSKGGFVVETKTHHPLSGHPLTKGQARKQLIAVALSEFRRHPKGPPLRSYF